MPDMTPVSSSNIQSIGYDAEAEELYVEFLNGSTYKYTGVPTDVHQALMTAPSHGQYLNANIKGVYDYSKV